MATDIVGAVDEIVTKLRVGWDANAPGISGQPAPPLYDTDLSGEMARPPNGDMVWGRYFIRHNVARARSIGGANGSTKFQRAGSLYVHIFIPIRLMGDDGSRTMGLVMADMVQSLFEGQATANVYFRAIPVTEAGPDGGWYRINVSPSFEWFERRSTTP